MLTHLGMSSGETDHGLQATSSHRLGPEQLGTHSEYFY
jgi:hypothetical protein